MLRAFSKLTSRGQKHIFIPWLCSSLSSNVQDQNIITNIDHFNEVVQDGVNVHAIVSDLKLRNSNLMTSMLNGLAEANVHNISPTGEETDKMSLVKAITLEKTPFDEYSVNPSTIYVRQFYPTLLNM